jgi:hypothetical protein
VIRPTTAFASIVLLFAVSADTAVGAWSPRTRLRMTREAIQMMPRSLRALLDRHADEVARGALEPLTSEGGPEHRPPWQGGTLPEAVAARSAAVTEAVDSHERFSEIALRLGELAHFVADAGFPPLAGGDGDDARYAHFSALVESHLEKIPLVFYGHGDPLLERGDTSGFVVAMLEEAREEDAELARAYAEAGPTPHPSAFDDRSVPFAIASLAYSRTVTRIVNVWVDAWLRAHGDLGRTPYLDPADPPRVRVDDP